MKEKDEIFKEYRISEALFERADISWETLTKIYEDYEQERYIIYQETGKNLAAELFQDPKEWGLHSLYWRVKEPEHLIAKIIRKRTENYNKYRNINEENYWKIVRDLVGFRGLMVFKEDWAFVHDKILSKFSNAPRCYISDNDYTQFDKVPNNYLAEPVKAHIREGDNSAIYEQYLGSPNILRKQNYRSVHYILKYENVCVELQLRTLFEDALSEMDHKIRYPLYATDEKLNRYAGIMNQLVGVVDEFGSYYRELHEGKQPVEKENKIVLGIEQKLKLLSAGQEASEAPCMETPAACLDYIIKN